MIEPDGSCCPCRQNLVCASQRCCVLGRLPQATRVRRVDTRGRTASSMQANGWTRVVRFDAKKGAEEEGVEAAPEEVTNLAQTEATATKKRSFPTALVVGLAVAILGLTGITALFCFRNRKAATQEDQVSESELPEQQEGSADVQATLEDAEKGDAAEPKNIDDIDSFDYLGSNKSPSKKGMKVNLDESVVEVDDNQASGEDKKASSTSEGKSD